MNTRIFNVNNIANGGNVVVGSGEQFNWAESGSQSCAIAVQGASVALSSANSFNVPASGASSTAVDTPGATGYYNMTPSVPHPNSIPFSIIVGTGKYDVASSGDIIGKPGKYFIWQNDGAAASVQCTAVPPPNWWPPSGYQVGGAGYLPVQVPGDAGLGTFQLQITSNGVTLSRPKIIIIPSLDHDARSEHEEHEKHGHGHHQPHEHKP